MIQSRDKTVFCNNCKYFIPRNDLYGIGDCIVNEQKYPNSFHAHVLNYYYSPRHCIEYEKGIFPAYDIDLPLSEDYSRTLADRIWLVQVMKGKEIEEYAKQGVRYSDYIKGKFLK